MASSSGFGTPHFRSSASSPLEPPPSGSADSSSSSALDLNNLKQEIVLKILVLGDLGVGKTSLVRRYTEGDASGKRCEAGVSSSHSALLLLELELSTFSFFQARELTATWSPSTLASRGRAWRSTGGRSTSNCGTSRATRGSGEWPRSTISTPTAR